MSSTIVLILGPDRTFSRSKIQFMPIYQKQSIHNLLDKIETIYQKMMPTHSKVIWTIYFLLLSLFLLSGVVKNLSHGSTGSVSRILHPRSEGDNKHRRLLQQTNHPVLSQVSSSSINSTAGETPMAASDMNMRLDEGPATDYLSGKLSYYDMGFLHDIKKGLYFTLEVFFLIFPFYYCWSRNRKRAFVLSLVQDIVEIENRQLITNCQFKVEVKDLSVITIVQFDPEGYQSDLDRSTTKLVLEKKSPSKKGSIQLSSPVVSI